MKVADREPDVLVDRAWRDAITLDRDGRIREYERLIVEARARQTACDPEALTEIERRLLEGNR